MKVLIGVPTFGNLEYTLLSLHALEESVQEVKFAYPNVIFDYRIVVGKPETSVSFSQKILEEFPNLTIDNLMVHVDRNYGLPWSINDIFHNALSKNFDYVLLIGNDVLLTDWFILNGLKLLHNNLGIDWLSGVEVHFPPSNAYDKIPSEVVWAKLEEWNQKNYYPEIVDNLGRYAVIGDSFNATFFSRNLIEKIGYVDLNFYPAYFSDNDYARRAQLVGAKMYKFNGRYIHLWSRTIYNETYKGISLKKINDFIFPKNEQYYIEKWGGKPGEEKYMVPFTSHRGNLPYRKYYASNILIDSPFDEDIISYWEGQIVKRFGFDGEV